MNDSRSFFFRRSLSLLLMGVCVIPSWAWSLRRTNTSDEISITSNGSFDAQFGMFWQEGNRVDLYSAVPEVLDPRTGKRVVTPDNDALRVRWKGEPYYHEVYELDSGKWFKKLRGFSRKPEKYLDFAPCDPLNQIDISSIHTDVSLGVGVKIKDVSEYGMYALVVYSDTPSKQVEYSLKVALLLRDGSHWRVLNRVAGDEDGFYCGQRSFMTRFANGQFARVMLLYTNEPAGSGDSIAVHSYLISGLNIK